MEDIEKEGKSEVGFTVDGGISRCSEGTQRGENSRQSRPNVPEEEVVGLRMRSGRQVDRSYQTRPTRHGQQLHPDYAPGTVLEENLHRASTSARTVAGEREIQQATQSSEKPREKVPSRSVYGEQ